jgi:hypothetical protein
MRIAISGAVSTGKTTLGKALAGELGLPFIAESMEDIPWRVASAAAFATGLRDSLEKKHAMEAAQDGFVVDRSPVDIFNFWLGRLTDHPDTEKIYALCANYMSDYDAVILLPWGVLALDQVAGPEEGVRRNLNRWVQLRGSALIAGLTYHFVSAHNDRVRHARERIEHIGRHIARHAPEK